MKKERKKENGKFLEDKDIKNLAKEILENF